MNDVSFNGCWRSNGLDDRRRDRNGLETIDFSLELLDLRLHGSFAVLSFAHFLDSQRHLSRIDWRQECIDVFTSLSRCSKRRALERVRRELIWRSKGKRSFTCRSSLVRSSVVLVGCSRVEHDRD